MIASSLDAPAERLPRARIWLALGSVLSDLVAIVLYFVIRARGGGATAALALAAVAPVTWTLLGSVWRRRLEPVGAASVIGFAVALAVTVLAGGSALPLKLRKPATTGIFGLACLVSVALRRPVLELALRGLAARQPALSAVLEPYLRSPRRLVVVTLLVGGVALAEAGSQTALALLLPTGAFLLAATAARWVILVAGAALIALYVRHRPAQESIEAEEVLKWRT